MHLTLLKGSQCILKQLIRFVLKGQSMLIAQILMEMKNLGQAAVMALAIAVAEATTTTSIRKAMAMAISMIIEVCACFFAPSLLGASDLSNFQKIAEIPQTRFGEYLFKRGQEKRVGQNPPIIEMLHLAAEASLSC